MIIYHAASFYQLLTCMVHCEKQIDEKKVLILGKNVLSVLNSTRELETIFDACISINISFGLSDALPDIDALDDYFTDIFSTNHIVIDEQTEIYVGGAQFNFGFYLTKEQIPFYFMEEACGLISQNEHIKKIDRNRECYPILEEYGLYDASNPCIKGIVCNVKEQEPGFMRENLIHFDTLKELSDFDETQRKSILKVFTDIDQIDIAKDTAVVLTQHYANLAMMSYERQALLYGVVLDYFLKGKHILLKKHPYDFMAYDVIYPQTEQIKERFPSEFLPFVFQHSPELIATISSTGIKSLRSVAPDCMEFDFDFEEFFEPIHKAYFALELIVKQENIKKIYTAGVNTAMLQNLCKYSVRNAGDIQIIPIEDVNDVEPGSVIIVDRVEKSVFCDWNIEDIAEYLTDKCQAKEIFCLNSKQDYVFHKSNDETIWNHVIPMEIKKNNLNELRDSELYDDFETETLYLFTMDKEIRKMALGFEQERTLDNLQIEVRTGGFSTQEQLRFSVMEGIVDATERRLQHYIRRCKELEQEVEQLRR